MANRVPRCDPWYVRWPLIGVASAFLTLFLIVPLLNVFAQALSQGWEIVWQTLSDPDTLAAARLTGLVTLLAVSFNLSFGLAAAWALARGRFPGQAWLAALIDLPFAVSPVVAGLLIILLFGASGYLAPLVRLIGVPVVFAVPGIVLATTFVTLPLIARELVPVLEAAGTEEEEAARILGASAWQTFWLITLPNIRWGLLYGVLLCTARAVGEFGAAAVVSGKLAGKTDTLPIHVEKLYQDLSLASYAGAFSVAAALSCLALLTLAAKAFLESRIDA